MGRGREGGEDRVEPKHQAKGEGKGGRAKIKRGGQRDRGEVNGGTNDI